MNKKRLAEHLEKVSTFKIVADLRSIHKAASCLGLSQPAVTRTIKVLEDVLECRLIERESRGIRLTSDGVRLYEFAALIAKTVDTFDVNGETESIGRGPLRLATYDNIACNIISGLSLKLFSELSRFSVSVGGPNNKILGDLVGGKHDCAFIAQPRVIQGITYKKLFSERYGLFVSPKFLRESGLGSKKSITVDDLKQYRLIAMPDAIAGANKNIDRILWEIGLSDHFTIDSYEVAMQFTRDDLGIGIMPLSTAWRDICTKHLHELHLKDVPRSSFGSHDLVLCWNSKQLHPGITILEKFLIDFFGAIKR